MNAKNNDQLLRIKTGGLGELPKQSIHYNHYEATPYKILDALFDVYELQKTDEFVDFGCGKGRVLFYVHNRFHNNVRGIEMSDQLYHQALKNKSHYMQKVKNKRGSIQVECCKAEEYDIKEAENRFYFFNPFSTPIFMKVVQNILLSVEQHKRSVEIILYYPIRHYIEFLNNKTPFELHREVKIPGLSEINSDERFMIYRFEG